MERISPTEVELTTAEMELSVLVDGLLDRGYGFSGARAYCDALFAVSRAHSFPSAGVSALQDPQFRTYLFGEEV